MGKSQNQNIEMNWIQRIDFGFNALTDIVGRVWPYILGGIALGAIIHGYIQENTMMLVIGKTNWWSIPLSIIFGVPMYSNAAGIIPITEALLGNGAAMGSVLALMMSILGLSLPEGIILRKVLELKLILIFFGIVAFGILIVGYVFNAIF